MWPETKLGRRAMLAILAVAFGLRAYNLLGMFPILVDESIYLRWAEIIDHQGQWFISLLDGKQPLSYWLLAIARKISDSDPLLQGRLLSVIVGLFSTVGIFAVGRLLAGETAGLISAALYACFPFALLYDRLAYTESFVNLAGIWIVWTSLECFRSLRPGWKREIWAGLVLGLGLFTKQTVLLFAFFPALAGLWLARKQERSLWPRLGVIYGIAALFQAGTWALTPEAPLLESHDAVLHHTGFFVDPNDLLANPLIVAPANIAKLGSYIATYLTLPMALASLAGLAYLTWRRRWNVWLVASVSIVPLVVQVFVLELMFPTRYPFPHMWPWLVVAAVAATDFWSRQRTTRQRDWRFAAVVAAALVASGSMLYRSTCMLASPRECLNQADVEGFLGSHAHVGYGIRDAVDFLIAESRKGPFVLLTDPIWGPPADAMFPYLNHRHGIRVHEAWWMQMSGNSPILPPGKAEILKSHYERTKAGSIDFSSVPRVLYVTDTHYYTPAAVKTRQPNAQLLRSFPKRDTGHSIDVYRVK